MFKKILPVAAILMLGWVVLNLLDTSETIVIEPQWWDQCKPTGLVAFGKVRGSSDRVDSEIRDCTGVARQ